MIGKGATEIRPVTLSEVEKILDKRQGSGGGEFGYEQQTTLSYAKTFARLKLSDAQGMVSELEKLGVPLATAVKIVDILPKVKPQLALILAKDRVELPEKKLAEISSIVEKHSKKAKKLVIEKPPEPEASVPAEAAEAPKEEKKGQ